MLACGLSLLVLLVPPLPAVGPGDKDIRAVLDAQVQAWNRRDLEGYMDGYWRSPELVFQSNGSLTRGFEPTLERYRARYQAAGREMGQLAFEGLEIQILAPDVAMARGGYHLVMGGGVERRGLFTLVLRRMDGAWRIVHDHSSGD